MNEEEKQAIKKFEDLLIKHFEDKKIDKVDYLDYFEGATILSLIEKQQKEIEDYQILKDDIEGHRIVYIDTPEFEEKYISKDKIIEEYNKKCDECNFNKSGICKELKAYNCCSIQSVLELLKVLIGETK